MLFCFCLASKQVASPAPPGIQDTHPGAVSDLPHVDFHAPAMQHTASLSRQRPRELPSNTGTRTTRYSRLNSGLGRILRPTQGSPQNLCTRRPSPVQGAPRELCTGSLRPVQGSPRELGTGSLRPVQGSPQELCTRRPSSVQGSTR